MTPIELSAIVIASLATAAAVLIALYNMRRGKTMEQPPLKQEAAVKWRYRASRSVSPDTAKEAGDELRILSLEREILSDAIRSLYEAHAEGKITEEEREQLAKRYKSRMMKIKEAITGNESVVALHELEAMQEDLTKLFNSRFDELNTKIESLRSQVGVETEETIVPIPVPSQIEVEEPERELPKKGKRRASRKAQRTRKTAAEERIEKIRAEVEKVLDRLGQMEAEA